MISAGYGDSLSVEEMIAQKEGLLHTMAAERGATEHDDTVQEARIALWEVSQKRPDAPAAYLHAAARTRIVEFVTRGKATGEPSRRGKTSDPLRMQQRDSLDDPDIHTQLEAAESLEMVQNAYVHGAVAEALDALTPQQRKYVQLRFWEDADKDRLVEEFGYDPNGIWKGAKPKLQRALAHLVAA